MSEKIDDFNEVTLVNEHDLIEEWKRQPSLYHHYASKLAEARKDYAEAKVELEVMEAELDANIRSDPAQYGVGKITEGSVEKTIKLQGSWLLATKGVLSARHRIDVLEAVVRTLEHRKSALENFVTLWLRDYYSSPKVKEEGDEEKLQEMQTATMRRKIQVRLDRD